MNYYKITSGIEDSDIYDDNESNDSIVETKLNCEKQEKNYNNMDDTFLKYGDEISEEHKVTEGSDSSSGFVLRGSRGSNRSSYSNRASKRWVH